MKKDELLGVTEAAGILQVSPRYVQKLIERGKLPARPIDEIVKGAPGYAIRRQDLEKLARNPVGRPKKPKP